MTNTATTLHEQLAYYCARAAEYDQWWLREGRYNRGEALNAQWFSETKELSFALSAFRPTGRVLELACGTGIWTEQLLRFASHITAVDGSAEMLSLNAGRLRSPAVKYLQADLFDWRPVEKYDAVFFAFWLSHIPPERFTSFWELVKSCLAPDGRVFFVDSRRDPTSTAVDHTLPNPDTTVLQRKLNDGRQFQIYKIFYDPTHLTERLRELSWDLQIQQTQHYFLYGQSR